MEHYVLIDDIVYVPQRASSEKTVSRFRVGDFVRTIGDRAAGEYCCEGLSKGMYGKVVIMRRDEVGVEFPQYNEHFNDVDRHCTNRHGLWFRPDQLEIVD